MTSRDRVLMALNKQEPDRVPIFEISIDPKVRSGIYPGCSYQEFVERIGLDIVLVPDQVVMKKIGKDVYIDDWEVVHRDTGEVNPVEIKSPISSKEDLVAYVPPNPLESYKLKELRAAVKQFKGKKAIGLWIRDAFSRPRRLMGMENLLISYIADPELAREVTNMSVNYNLKLLEKGIEEGADLIVSTDDYAGMQGPLISPHHFQEFILPGLAKLVRRTHELGAKYIKHTDGDIRPILDMIIDTGIDGLHPIDPGAGMDIVEVKKKYGNRICVVGNVDCMHTLTEASVNEVTQEVRGLISKLAPGGGYMISSSNSIHRGVKPKNYMAMINAAREYGTYPMDKA